MNFICHNPCKLWTELPDDHRMIDRGEKIEVIGEDVMPNGKILVNIIRCDADDVFDAAGLVDKEILKRHFLEII